MLSYFSRYKYNNKYNHKYCPYTYTYDTNLPKYIRKIEDELTKSNYKSISKLYNKNNYNGYNSNSNPNPSSLINIFFFIAGYSLSKWL